MEVYRMGLLHDSMYKLYVFHSISQEATFPQLPQ
jgi:hypothetical protein